MTMKAPWIVSSAPDRHACLRCQATLELDLTEGMSVETFIRLARDFWDAHQKCTERPPSPPEPTRCPATKDMFT